MKEEYIRRVKGHLPLPRQQKREVLRDLEEIFASAGEHGESEAQVLDRLGSPEEYAREVLAQTGYAPRPGKAALGLALSALVCGVCLALFLWSQSGRPVSYTHLDVYKRQLMEERSRVSRVPSSFSMTKAQELSTAEHTRGTHRNSSGQSKAVNTWAQA